MDFEFSDYAIKLSRTFKLSRGQLDKNLIPHLQKIFDDLADDPDQHPERLMLVSSDENTYVYTYPDPVILIAYKIDRDSQVIYVNDVQAPNFKPQKTIFISYSHKDRDTLDELKKFLIQLEKQGMVNFWDDEEIKAGNDWKQTIEDNLATSIAGLLLISQDFLASSFINDVELPKLLKDSKSRKKSIYWIPVKPSTVFEDFEEITRYESLLKNPLRTLQEMDDAERNKAFVEIKKRLSDAVVHH